MFSGGLGRFGSGFRALGTRGCPYLATSRALDLLRALIFSVDPRLALFSAGAFFCSDWGLLVGPFM